MNFPHWRPHDRDVLDRDVFLFEGVDERRVIHALDAFPAGENDRMPGGIEDETQRRALGEMKVHVAAQLDGAGVKLAWRHDHATAAGGVTRVDGFADRI